MAKSPTAKKEVEAHVEHAEHHKSKKDHAMKHKMAKHGHKKHHEKHKSK